MQRMDSFELLNNNIIQNVFMRMPNLHCKFNVINVSKLYYMKFATEPRKNTRSFRYDSEPAKTQKQWKKN